MEKGVEEMKKLIFLIFILSAQMLLPQAALGGSYTGTFKMTVTIPAVIGINVPDPDASQAADMSLTMAENNVVSNVETQMTEEKIVRDHQNITLRTLVVL